VGLTGSWFLGRLKSGWNRWLGSRGERLAASYLRRRGLRILARNFSTPRGEIDLIARDRDTLVFVEVKTRRQGTPAEAVDLEKQRRLTLAALSFLKLHRLLNRNVPCRFDVVAIVWPSADDPSSRPQIEHFPSAFDATGVDSMHT
jgi:putative endonuclease